MLSVFIGLFYGFTQKLNLSFAILIGIPVSLCLTPYAWSHDFILLLPAHLFLLNQLLLKRGYATTFLLSLVLFIVSFTFVAIPTYEQYLWPYPFLYLLIGKEQLKI
jgi:hypothetical protein